eukprot:CAMPEP_0170503470 /NCGR_PEP_ID=MMETSP0208-20121228/44877_1 /TAXON_ID=197538 /ORGANISM="Strombidium inclinatum, Strain S3" /LENGTH=129 /DNA_ID=CAMNT_0010783153 /DNA_START=1345 /DNA_END=1734 /DNA_ORIENTATION=+
MTDSGVYQRNILTLNAEVLAVDPQRDVLNLEHDLLLLVSLWLSHSDHLEREESVLALRALRFFFYHFLHLIHARALSDVSGSRVNAVYHLLRVKGENVGHGLGIKAPVLLAILLEGVEDAVARDVFIRE